MSALTDLFTALANKIRSKTGGSDTYTPAEMVSDGIDDVYDAGYAAGGGGVSPASITPSDSNPAAMTNGSVYQANGSGYAIASSPTAVTPSASGTAFTSGIKKMSSAGYAYSAKPTPSLQSKTSAPNVSTNKTVSPDSGYDGLSQVTITPLSHTGYSPSSSTYTQLAMGESKSIDLGANHDKRYVRVQAAAPSGTKSISANGTGIDVTSYASVNVNVPGPTLSGDAAVGNVLSGKTFYNTSTTKQTGTMTNNGAVSPTALSAGGSYTVPAGYHNGSGVVSAKDLASQTGVDSGKTAVTAAKMFSGYQGWVNGNKVSGTYVEPTINDITPSSTPIELTDGVIYKAHKRVPSAISYTAGYAIEAYTSVTPTASGAQFSQGMVNMSDGGYAYTAKPTKIETELWTNSSPTSSFAEQTITLSQAFTNFDLIKIEYQASVSKTTKGNVYVDKTTLQQSLWSDASKPLVSISGRNNNASGSTQYVRRIVYVSTTQLTITAAYQINSNNSATNSAIPTKITGIKFSGITF